MKEISYPYFFLGFSFKLSDIDPKTFETSLSKMRLFRRFTYEEAMAPCEQDQVKSVSVICGTPHQYDEASPLSNCEYAPILLKDFIASGGRVIPEANLCDINNLRVYINGNAALPGEEYALDTAHNVIQILWDYVKDTDVFSFSAVLKSG